MTAPPSPVAQILADMLKHLLMGDANTAMNALGGGGVPGGGPMGGGGGMPPMGGLPPPMAGAPQGGMPAPPSARPVPPHAAPPRPRSKPVDKTEAKFPDKGKPAGKKPPPKKARRGAMSAMPKKGK